MPDLQQARAAAERIFEILDTHSEVVESPKADRAAALCAIGRLQQRLLLRTRAPTRRRCAG